MLLAIELIPEPLRFTSRKECKSAHGTWGPQKAYFQAYTIHCHNSMGFVVGEAKGVLLLQPSGDHGIEIPF
jgi:hypothetical protein